MANGRLVVNGQFVYVTVYGSIHTIDDGFPRRLARARRVWNHRNGGEKLVMSLCDRDYEMIAFFLLIEVGANEQAEQSLI